MTEVNKLKKEVQDLKTKLNNFVAAFTYQGRGRVTFANRGTFRGRLRPNFEYNRGRESNGPGSTPQTTQVQCWRCFGYNHFARHHFNPPQRGQPMRGRATPGTPGTPWQTRRLITATSGPENAQAEGQEKVKPYHNQENRFEVLGTLDAQTNHYGDVLSSHVTPHMQKSN